MLFLKKEVEIHQRFAFTICLTLGLGYFGYALVPAQGPMYTQTFQTPLDLYYLQEIKQALMDHTRIERDCFPSLHTAITCVCAFSAWRYLRPLFWLFLPMTLTIPIACIYLRYHYVSDVIGGFMLAAFTIGCGSRANLKRSGQKIFKI